MRHCTKSPHWKTADMSDFVNSINYYRKTINSAQYLAIMPLFNGIYAIFVIVCEGRSKCFCIDLLLTFQDIRAILRVNQAGLMYKLAKTGPMFGFSNRTAWSCTEKQHLWSGNRQFVLNEKATVRLRSLLECFQTIPPPSTPFQNASHQDASAITTRTALPEPGSAQIIDFRVNSFKIA